MSEALQSPFVFREETRPTDVAIVAAMVASTGVFSEAEADVAVELVQERLAKGEASGYHFVFADRGAETVGYVCYGPIPATLASYDLYWIVVLKSEQGRGLGSQLLAAAEARIHARGGRRVYVETSSRPDYAPTRGFYRGQGYELKAELEDFYAPGDGKQIWLKVLA